MIRSAEVLGRYSNQAIVGTAIGSVLEVTSDSVRDAPWDAPTLLGTSRVRRLLASQLDRMIADYKQGMGCVLPSRRYGIAENTVLARLKEAGVDVHPRGYLAPGALTEMKLLRAEGWTLQALGNRYGVTRQTVAKRLRTPPGAGL